MEIGLQFLMPFNKKNITENELSIQIFKDGFSFCNHFSKKFIPFKEIDIQSNDVFKNFLEENAYQDFDRVTTIFIDQPATFVPNKLYNEKNIELYLSQNISLNPLLQISREITQDEEIVVLYESDKNREDTLRHYFKNIDFSHFSVILYDLIQQVALTNEKTEMYINMQNNQFDLLVFNSGKLMFYNSFPHKNEEDFLYYLFAMAEQYSLDPDLYSIHFLGKYSRFNSYYEALKNYHKEIEYTELEALDSLDLDNHPAPYFFNLMA